MILASNIWLHYQLAFTERLWNAIILSPALMMEPALHNIMYRSMLLDIAKADRTAPLYCQEKSVSGAGLHPQLRTALHSQPLMHWLQTFWDRGQDLSANVY